MNSKELGLVSMAACLILLFDVPIIGLFATLALGIILSGVSKGTYRNVIILIIIYVGYEVTTRAPMLIGSADVLTQVDPFYEWFKNFNIFPVSVSPFSFVDSIIYKVLIYLVFIVGLIAFMIYETVFVAPYMLFLWPMVLMYNGFLASLGKAISGEYFGVPWINSAFALGNIIILPLLSQLLMIYTIKKLATRYKIAKKWGIMEKIK